MFLNIVWGGESMENKINDRISELRKYLKMNQEDFGGRIGLTKTAISYIESSKRGVTESNIKLICTTYNVNEDWLRNGKGEMFVETRNSFLSGIVSQYNLDEFDQVILESYFTLPPDKRAVIKEYIQTVTRAFNSNNETAAAERKIDEEVESYRRELEAELKGAERSSVLQDIGGKKEAN